jgi:hypothetical protein
MLVIPIVVGLVLVGCHAAPETATPISWTPLPIAQATPTSTPVPTQQVLPRTQFCEDDARFLEDITIPDGTIVVPGAELDKRWSVQNSGTCDWGPGYRLVRVVDDPFEGPDSLALYPARSGMAAVWQVVLKAPLVPGDYLSRWQAQDPNGQFFGDEVFLLILVEAPTPTPTVTPLVSPTPQ